MSLWGIERTGPQTRLSFGTPGRGLAWKERTVVTVPSSTKSSRSKYIYLGEDWEVLGSVGRSTRKLPSFCSQWQRKDVHSFGFESPYCPEPGPYTRGLSSESGFRLRDPKCRVWYCKRFTNNLLSINGKRNVTKRQVKDLKRVVPVTRPGLRKLRSPLRSDEDVQTATLILVGSPRSLRGPTLRYRNGHDGSSTVWVLLFC